MGVEVTAGEEVDLELEALKARLRKGELVKIVDSCDLAMEIYKRLQDSVGYNLSCRWEGKTSTLTVQVMDWQKKII